MVKLELSYSQYAIVVDALMTRIEGLEKVPAPDEDMQLLIYESKKTLDIIRKTLQPRR